MAKQTNKLSIRLTDKEQIWGIIYLLLSTFLLPAVLRMLNNLLPVPLGNAWFNFSYFACNFLCIFWIFHGFFKRSLIYAGNHFWDYLVSVVAGFAAYWLMNWGLSLLFGWLFPTFTNLNDGSIITMARGNFLVMLIGTVFLVPIAEEALHRGLVFGSLYPKSHVAAYLVSAAVFSGIHIIGYVGVYTALHLLLAFVQYLPAGLVLAWAYRKSGSIFAPILIHAVINAIGLLSMR